MGRVLRRNSECVGLRGVIMEEYIRMLLEQVRFQKAHKAIGDEIRSHIEDQIEKNISEGMEKETAEKKAVEDMGDPVEAGVRLDKVHRPQVAWNVIIVAILIGVIGIIVQKIIANDGLLDGSSSPYSPEVMKYMYFASGPKMYKLYTALGIAAMLFMYLVDYTTVARHSKVIAFWLIAINYLIIYVGLDHTPICLKGHKGLIVKIYHVTIPMMFLLIPLFAGILYKYRGQSYGGLIKALLWIVIPQIKAVIPYNDNKISDLVLAVSMLVQLTVAIKKNWIKVRKLPSIISIWALYAVYVAHFAYIGYNTESFYPID